MKVIVAAIVIASFLVYFTQFQVFSSLLVCVPWIERSEIRTLAEVQALGTETFALKLYLQTFLNSVIVAAKMMFRYLYFVEGPSWVEFPMPTFLMSWRLSCG